MRVDLTKNEVYVVTTTAPVTLTCESGGTTFELAHVEPGQQGTFKALENYCEYDCAGKVDIRNFNGAPAGLLGGGGSTMTLRTGVLAPVRAEAVVVCGDLGSGGTLTDGTTELTLPCPDVGRGQVALLDAAAAGSIQFGAHEAIALPAKAGVKAEGYVDFMTSPGSTVLSIGGVEIVPEDGTSEESWHDAINAAASCGAECYRYDSYPRIKLYLRALDAGAAGDEIAVTSSEPDDDCGEGHLTGGQNARTPQEVVDAITAAAAEYLTDVHLDADEGVFSFKEAERGDIDVLTVSGGLFGSATWTESEPDYTVADIVETVNASESFSATARAGEGGYILTAKAAGAGGNTVVYTATGCFGTGETAGGSTRRGSDEVKGQFQLASGASARYLVQGYEGMSVEWPEDWLWLEGRAPYLDDGKNYIIEAVNDGHQTISKKLIEYDRTSN